MDDIIYCPITGNSIGPGEGDAVMDSRGNVWIVHKDVPADQRRSDPSGTTLNGHKPVTGPDA